MKSQKIVWENLASDWFRLKNNPIKNVMKFLSEQEGSVLDLGSGAGRHLVRIKNGQMYLVDFSEKMIEFAKKKAKKKNTPAEFIVADMTNLPFKDNFFDSAICISALHCIPKKSDREKAVRELYRVLKPRAKAYIALYNKNSKQFRNAGKERLIRWKNKELRYYYIFDEKEAHELFEKNGFRVVKKFPRIRSIEFVVEKN